MNKIGRRMFCGSALMAFPLLALRGQDLEIAPPQTDLLIDTLADEITRITADGARKGFRAEHFRRYASVVRSFGAHMEVKGVNRELNRRLEEDDFGTLDPAAASRITVDYWARKGLSFNAEELTRQISMPRQHYLEIKSAIKKQGGVRWLYKAAADAFERKAKDYESMVYRGGPKLQKGAIFVPGSKDSCATGFAVAQYDIDLGIFVGANIDCLCQALIATGALLTIMCLTIVGAQELCAIGAFLVALANLMQSLGMCDADRC